MPELQDVHRRWRHLRSGGEIQTVLVSLTGFIAPQEVRQHRTGPIKDGFIAVYSFTYLVLRIFFSFPLIVKNGYVQISFLLSI